MKSTRFWLIGLGGLALLSLLATLLLAQLREDGAFVDIIQDGDIIQTLPLSEDKLLRVRREDGSGYNFVSIKEGLVSITDASCPDRTCVNTPATHQRARPIVCLPNRLELRVHGSNTDTVDGVVG